MRKLNAILTVIILVLFIIHAIAGSLQMTGAGQTSFKALARVNVGFIIAHMAISIALTWNAVRVWRRAGTGYFKENKLFWARRISGIAVMVLLIIHMTTFSTTVDSVYRLQVFTTVKMICQILLVAAIALHVISNVKPVLMSFGIKSFKSRTADIIIIISVVLVAVTVAFVIYWLRWNG